MGEKLFDPDFVGAENARAERHLELDYAALGEKLSRGGVDIDDVTDKVGGFGVAVPSWGVGTGGTRFARFPGPGEPRGIWEKLDDCAAIQTLARATPRVSLHVPWDLVDDPAGAEGAGRRARARVRRDELEHLPGPARAGALLQVRLAQPHRRRGAGAGGRAQPRLHRLRAGARVEGADGLDRRRLELPRAEPLRPGVRALPRQHGADLRRPAGGLAALQRAQGARAGVLFDGGAGLGHQLHGRAARSASGRSASSTSGITRRTSTSR